MKTIAIIGAGFAGLNLAKRLDKNKYRVKIIDRNNFHAFPPLFYQIASSGLEAGDISFPLRRELKKFPATSYHMGHVKNIDTEAHTVTTSYETITYDILVIAAGTSNNYFGNNMLAETTFGIKTVNEAIHARDEILDRLERAAICRDPRRRKELLSFLVVGGGPTGVEIAGAIGEMKKYVLPKEYPELSPDDMKITLVEGSGCLLGAMGEKCGASAEKDLKELMVEVRKDTFVKDYSGKIVTFADGSTEYWETVIWTAGVKGEPMPGLPAEMTGRGGRIIVDRYHRVSGRDDLYAIGDISLMSAPDSPHGHPQVAQAAIQQALNLARNLNSDGVPRPFRYRDKGAMATVGKHRAVVAIGRTSFNGFFAWLVWMFVHLMSIMGMRNKMMVLLNWVWSYFSYSHALRLLIRPVKFPLHRHWGD